MQSSSKDIHRKIRSKCAEIFQIKKSYSEKIKTLKNKETSLSYKVDFEGSFSLITGGAKSEELHELEDIRNELKKLKEERTQKIAKARQELDAMKHDYRKNFEKYKKEDRKIKTEKIENIKFFFMVNKIKIIGIGTAAILLVSFLTFSIRNYSRRVSEAKNKEYYIDIVENQTLECKTYEKTDNIIYCRTIFLEGSFSNYDSTFFKPDTDISVSENNFKKTLNISVPDSLYKVETFSTELLLVGFDKTERFSLYNSLLGHEVAQKTVKIHLDLSDDSIRFIEQIHNKWVDEENQRREEEAKRQEEQARKEAEERAAKEEAERKAAEEKAAKEEASRIYKWKTIQDGEECPSNAELCYISDGGYGYAKYNYGTVSGRIYNNTGRDINYMQLSETVYNSAGIKIGDCFDNTSGLKTGKTWAFEAYCTGWDYGVTTSDLDITWW